MDVTDNKNYTLDLKTRSLVWNLERPLVAKVYFTEGLQAPYNNHRTILIDQLEELRAYAKGWLKLEVVDPTTLLPATKLDSETRVILAVKIGKTRLIDNANLSLSDTLSAAYS